MNDTNKYLGTYRLYSPTDSNGKVTRNEDDSYLKCKYNIQVFRYSNDKLAIQFLHNSTLRLIQPQLEAQGINLTPFVQGDSESVWLFDEKHIHKVAEIIKPNTKGANIKPKSIKTARQVNKKKSVKTL